MWKVVRNLLLGGLASLTLASANAQTPKTSDSADLVKRMGGEKVLPLSSGPLVNPLCRFDEHPWFEISNLRPGSNLRNALEMDFVCTGPLTGTFHVVAITNGRQHRFPISTTVLNQRRGLITCSYDVLKDKTEFGADVEAYVEFTDTAPIGNRRYYRSAPKPVNPLYFKVSKSAIRGNVPTVTYARELRPNELRIYETRKKKYGPPPPPPAGYSVAERTVTLVPGTPVLAAFEGEWMKAEVLSVSQASGTPRITIHWPQLGHARNKWHPTSAIALSKETVEKLATDPSSFKPSVIIPEGALQPPPAGEVVLTADVKLVPGTPVSVYIVGGGWEYKVTSATAGTVTAIRNPHGRQEEQFRRDQITIRKDVLAQLKSPKAVAEFAAELTAMRKATRKRSFRSYPIRIDIPSGYARVTEKTPLKPGMKCKVSWGSRWDEVELLSAPEDGGVEIYWPKWSNKYVVTLESLIASESAVQTPIARNNATAATTENGKSMAASHGPTFRIRLKETKRSRVAVMKLIMELTDVDLPTAKEVLDFTPIVVKSGLTSSAAEEWREKFEAAGAVVTVEADKTKQE